MTEEDGGTGDISHEEVNRERERINYRQRFRRVLSSTIGILVVVAAVAVLVSTLFLPVIQVSGDSMEPSLHDGDILVLYKTKRYTYGELCCVAWQNKLLLKRVIGLPGDIIRMDPDGTVYVNDERLDEPYVTEKSLGECDITFPYQVPDGMVFVLGDHRSTSIDSRSTVIGCIAYDQMIGQVLFRIWSSNNA
ncbi:MAG: signal peptidase I [Oscillospiraceae bacterium]|nr:signal peptidase I [Oscillospiraceae bacterium]